MPPITCVLSGILGNRILSTQLGGAVDRYTGSSEKLWFDGAVYRNYPAPRWIRRISAYESEYVARRWLHDHPIDGAVVVNGYPLAMAGMWKSMVVATDATPAMTLRMGGTLGSRVVKHTLSARFRRLARHALAWLPISETCRQSLLQDYGVSPQRCYVTRSPQPSLDPRPHAPTGSILFVGNDFERKGGPTLLSAFERDLLPDCRLTIVSNDPCLEGTQISKSVRIVSGIRDPAQLIDIYRQADLLVLPTRSDVYSLVICEAAAQGVPALATRVGGVGELLDESGGMSLPRNCSAEDIAAGIREALGPSYTARANSAARFAREKLTLSAFDENVRNALNWLS